MTDAMDQVTSSILRLNLRAILNGIHRDGKPVAVTRHGQTSAVIVSAEEYARLLECIDNPDARTRRLETHIADALADDGAHGPSREAWRRRAKRLLETAR